MHGQPEIDDLDEVASGPQPEHIARIALRLPPHEHVAWLDIRVDVPSLAAVRYAVDVAERSQDSVDDLEPVEIPLQHVASVVPADECVDRGPGLGQQFHRVGIPATSFKVIVDADRMTIDLPAVPDFAAQVRVADLDGHGLVQQAVMRAPDGAEAARAAHRA
jgi:hypothetical protein